MTKKNINKNKKKVSSIAVKINSHFTLSILKKYIIIDIMIFFVLIFMWCYKTEANEFNGFFTGKRMFYPSSDFKNFTYSVYLDNGKELHKDATELVLDIRNIIIALSIVQLISLIKSHITGNKYIKGKLKPLDEIAETTDKLSSMAFDESKMQSLEDAIENISVVSNEDKIHIKDSELKGIENSINNLLERMRDSYRQQARFVSDASHELRTPIAVIQGYANMLDRWGKEDEKVLEESIEAIKSESLHMKNLIEQLLFLARGINGKTKLNLSQFSLTKMINEVYEESIMIDENHIYRYSKKDDIYITGDEELLKQTARILVENAAKYTQKGEIILLKVFINKKNEPAFSVSDNGIGIGVNDVSHIFERFFRADSARDRKTGGTGLGLSIAKWIIDNHKGYFEVLSREDIGTKIIVNLPYINIKK
ncbi:sensor histidine kinase [Clostridium sp. HCP1S3_B4]|uniref:sensor histidine kinase n=1 Tax=unclassified Clostridium TaxID=2614128 RepID=UPI003F8A6FC5